MNEAARFANDGYTVFGRVFAPDFVDTLKEEYLRQFPDVAAAPERYEVGHRRMQVPVALNGTYLSPDLYANRALLQFATAVLGDDHLIDSLAVVTALPQAKDQQLHLDHADLFPGNQFARAVIGAYAITVAIPLVDLTPETGTTKLFTRSHVRPMDEDEFELPYMERGRCYAMDYRLWHRGTENRSNAERPIIYLVYARPWFTDIGNYGRDDRIRIADADLAQVPEEHRMLFRRLSRERSGSGARKS